MKLAWLLFAALPVVGQTLHLSSVAGAPGGTITVEISLDSSSGVRPVALQWETIFPAQLLEVEGKRFEIGWAARDSGKSVACSERKPYTYICVLAGGQNPIANGPIAIVHFKIRTEARPGTSVVRLVRVEAVTADLKKSVLKEAEGTVSIH